MYIGCVPYMSYVMWSQDHSLYHESCYWCVLVFWGWSKTAVSVMFTTKWAYPTYCGSYLYPKYEIRNRVMPTVINYYYYTFLDLLSQSQITFKFHKGSVFLTFRITFLSLPTYLCFSIIRYAEVRKLNIIYMKFDIKMLFEKMWYLL